MKKFGSNKYTGFSNPNFRKPKVDIPIFAPTSIIEKLLEFLQIFKIP